MVQVNLARKRFRRRCRAARAAFTAFEVLLATAILAFISISVSSALWAGRQQTANAQSSIYASFLAQQLMEEITRLPLDMSLTLGPGAGENSRASFNGADDYAGYSDGVSAAKATITDLAGNAYPAEYQKFTRRVAFRAMSYTPANWGRTISGYLVTVEVLKDGIVYARLEQFIMP